MSSFMFTPCQLRPRSCLHGVVLYNKIRAGHTTFLLLVTNVCHTNNFSKTDLPTVTQDACDWVKTQSATKGVKQHFYRRSSSCSTDFQKINLSILTPLNTPDSHFTLTIVLLAFSKRNLLHKPGYYILNKPGSPIEHWSATLRKDSPICNIKKIWRFIYSFSSTQHLFLLTRIP